MIAFLFILLFQVTPQPTQQDSYPGISDAWVTELARHCDECNPIEFRLINNNAPAVNQQHPPIQVKLQPTETRKIAHSTPSTFAEWEIAKRALIDSHQPKHQSKFSFKPCKEGYLGHIYRPEDIIYTWETPNCAGTK